MAERTGRVVGVDVARFVALAGMMAIHILPASDADGVTTSQSLAGGRSSALFAVLAGVSLTLVTGRRPLVGADRWRAAAGVLVRAAFIGGLGLWLGELQTSIAVILTYYGLLFALGIPFLGARTRTLFVLSAVWIVTAPVLSQVLRPHLERPSLRSPSFEDLRSPVTLTVELLFTGYYPVFVWLGYLLVGMAVGRLDLRSWRTIGLVGAVGACLAAASYAGSELLLRQATVHNALVAASGGSAEALELELDGSLRGTTPTNTWWWLVVHSAHSGTSFDLAHTIGTALLVLALCLVVGRLVREPDAVLFGAGAMTLTLYTAHVVSRSPGLWDGETMDVYVGQVLAALAIGMPFGLARLKGPLEWFVSELTSFARPRRHHDRGLGSGP